MMTLSAFWGDHEIARTDAAAFISRVFEHLAHVDPLLASWRKRGRSHRKALANAPIDLTADGLAPLLQVNRTDFGRKPIPELGYRFGAWNGASAYGDEAGVSVSIGIHAANPRLVNSFVLSLPKCWTADDERIDRLVEILARELNPDRIVCFSEGTPDERWVRSQLSRSRESKGLRMRGRGTEPLAIRPVAPRASSAHLPPQRRTK
jgi:hypothetical protein